ncbi:MAG: 1-deoxy-D-xylulose-5-phosphate reductoisomerase [Planctomycetota bacterium]|jgi:1-deoxy-D-xylulose-5-phosphate reductoisomerase
MSKRVAVLGSTGSVGTSALSIIADRPEMFELVALSAHSSAELLDEQTRRFHPKAACLVQGELSADSATACFQGAEGILEALEAVKPDIVLNGITGAAGLPASEWTLRHGLNLALANKESLVMAGPYLLALAEESGASILPVDSEHCAIHQCLRGERIDKLRRIFLTASGGPFRSRELSTFGEITPDQALKHPTWDMGPRITVGSATMMNKAFEILEARWLFGLEAEQIEVLIHPQSIVHSMVEFIDGSMIAQLGLPDMRVPILYCLSYPERTSFDFEPFDPARFANLEFMPVDPERFPAVPLAYETLSAGGDSGAVLNAADEVMTGQFLDGRVRFPEITESVARILREHRPGPIDSLDDVFAADRSGRTAALEQCNAK